MKHARSALAGLLAMFVASAAFAQTFPTVPSNTVIGRLGGGTSGPSQAIPFATLSAILVPGATSAESCGAKGDGVTDDAPAIRTCMAQVAAQTSGGTVAFSCNKTYLLGSKLTAAAILRPYSNVTMQMCPSATLKVAANMNTASTQFYVIAYVDATAINNFKVIGGTIDFNGVNNSCGGTCFYNNMGIGLLNGSNIVIDGVRFINNPGSQNIAINAGVDGLQITNTVHEDSCDLVNAACTDHSSIFVYASNYTITNNTCRYSTQGARSTCWEMWGINGTASNNTVHNYAKMVNIAGLSALGTGITRNISMVNNAGYGLVTGLNLWCDAIGSSLLSDVVISNNVFQQSVQGQAFFDFDGTITGTCAKNIEFTNNIFSSAVAAGTASTVPTLKLGRAANQVVSGNLFTGGLGPAIGGGTFAAVTSFRLLNNIIIDAGQTSTAGSRRGVLISSGTTVDSFSISGNRVENIASAYMTTGIDVTLNTTYGFVENNNLISNIATPTAFVGTGYTVVVANSLPFATAIGTPFQNTGAVAGGILNGNTTGIPLMTITPTIGVPGTSVGTLCFANATSGCVKITPATGALGTSNWTLIAATDTFVGKATTDILTNKTFNTAGAGNVFQIAGTGITAITGTTGTLMAQTAPTFLTSMTGPLLIGGTGTTDDLILQPTSGAGTTGANIIFRGGNNGATTWGTWQDGGFLTVGASASTGDLLTVNGAANQGVSILNGAGGVRVAFRWNASVGGYFQLLDTSGATTGSLFGAGTGDQYFAPTGAGAAFGFNTTTPTTAQTGTVGMVTSNGGIKTSVVAFASLPTCNAANAGARYGVNNSNTAVFLAAIAGGGANLVPAYCNGTAWVVGANDNVPASLRRNYADASASRRAA